VCEVNEEVYYTNQ